MINFRLPLPAVNTSITRPVVNSILNELKSMLGIDDKVHTKVTTDTKDYANKYWNLGNQSKDINKQTGTTVLTCKYTESFDETHSITIKTRRNDTKPILYDDVTKLTIKPLFLETTVNLELNLFSKSESKLLELMNLLRIRYLDNNDAKLHSVQYLYYLNPALGGLLKDINNIQNIMMPDTPETLTDFIERISDDRATSVGTQSGNVEDLELAFKERQNKVLGMFKGEVLNNKVEFNKDMGYWTVILNYEYRYDKPLYLDITYPVTVYNRVMPKKYITRTSIVSGSKDGNLTGSQSNFEAFTTDAKLYKLMQRIESDGNLYIKSPLFDVHENMEKSKKTHRIFSTLAVITNEDKHLLCNLKELGELELDPIVLQFIEDGEYHYVTDYFKSLIHLELYENSEINSDIELRVDSDLNVYAVEELDISKQYRVMFSILLDTSLIETQGIERILNVEDLKNKIITIAKITTGENTDSLDFYVNNDLSINTDREQARAWTVQYSQIATELLKNI